MGAVTAPPGTGRPVRIANCSGFYGDRLSAAREMVDGGPIDVLTGDWLAELTMLILAKNRRRDPSSGYARTFVTQMEQVMGDCLSRGIRVVSNAGGLAPRAGADAGAAVAAPRGRAPVIATVEGDDLLPRIDDLRAAGVDFPHLETGAPLGDRRVMTANAYLGGWGVADALARGADIVITGRVTDAALTVGPAAWWHGWATDDWDALAGAVVAGHVIECGPQCCGGNYSFFTEIADLTHPGFPIAEVAVDGSSVITKHTGHGGAVTVGTVTAQLLYEIGPAAYANPDVTARFDSITLADDGADRVRISGVRGDSPPATTKVALNFEGGWKTTTTLLLAGLDIEAKAALVEAGLAPAFAAVRAAGGEVGVDLVRTDRTDPPGNEAAMAQLRVTVRGPDERVVGRRWSAAVTELALSSYPGLCTGPSTSGAYGVYWPALVPATFVHHDVDVAGDHRVVDAVVVDGPPVVAAVPATAPVAAPGGPTAVAPIGRVVGARSGDKGGNANLGVWARSPAAYAWMAETLTVDRLRTLLPDTAHLPVTRVELPNILAVNFVITGLLGEGVASSARIDPQAKSLGEYLRAKLVDVPTALLEAL
jgi:hypothetical protein